MDATTKYSVGAVVPETSTQFSIFILEAHSTSHFWAPSAIQYDLLFNNREFKDFLPTHDIQTTPIPPRQHNKNFHPSSEETFSSELKEVMRLSVMQLQLNKQFAFQMIYMGMTFALPVNSQKNILKQLNQKISTNCS